MNNGSIWGNWVQPLAEEPPHAGQLSDAPQLDGKFRNWYLECNQQAVPSESFSQHLPKLVAKLGPLGL